MIVDKCLFLIVTWARGGVALIQSVRGGVPRLRWIHAGILNVELGRTAHGIAEEW